MKTAIIYNVTSEYPDEAIDVAGSNIVEYMKSFNPIHIKVKEGMTPVKFNIKRLSPVELSTLQKISGAFSEEAANANAVGYGLISYTMAGGEPVAVEREEKKVENSSVSTAKSLNALVDQLSEEFGYDIITELGIAIRKVSRMPLILSPFLSK